MTVFGAIGACRLCGEAELRPLLDLGSQALSGVFPGEMDDDPPATPLELVRCGACDLVQMRHSVDGALLYGAHYGYRSGVNQTMRAHLSSLAGEAAVRADLRAGDVVLDIASNDGTLLNSYDVAGVRRIGIDPIISKFKSYYAPDVQCVKDYFSGNAFAMAAGGQKAKLITSIAVFYDLENPGAFVGDIKRILANDGLWILEQSYLPEMVAKNSYDTVCQEHLEYYALRQIDRLCDENGLRVVDVEFNEINGGSFRLYVCHADGPYLGNLRLLAEIRAQEDAFFSSDASGLQGFPDTVAASRRALKGFIEEQIADGRTIMVYGASTKGNVIVQYCGLTEKHIAAAADRNPEKWRRRLPGTNISIISEQDARDANPDYFLALPWHFREEFIERERAFLERGGKFIFPLPELEIVGVDGVRRIDVTSA